MGKEKFKRVFYRYSRQRYAETAGNSRDRTEEFSIAKASLEGGCYYDFSIIWYLLSGRDSARVEIFHDAFAAFEEDKELFQHLSTKRDITPDELHLLLLELGYEDWSDNKEVPKNDKNNN